LLVRFCSVLFGRHAIFGRVRSGMTVVQRLGMVSTDADDRPISEVRVTKGEATA
jgi:peptidyl-prolyl cis-trans isomerase-like 1